MQGRVYYRKLDPLQRIPKAPPGRFMVINVHIPSLFFSMNALKTRVSLLISLLADVYLLDDRDIQLESTEFDVPGQADCSGPSGTVPRT